MTDVLVTRESIQSLHLPLSQIGFRSRELEEVGTVLAEELVKAGWSFSARMQAQLAEVRAALDGHIPGGERATLDRIAAAILL